MNIFSRLWYAVKARELPVSFFLGQTQRGTGEYSYETYAREGYGMNPVVYTVIRSMGLAAASVRWYVGREDSEGEIEELPNHPVARTILQRPNPYQAWAQWVVAYFGFKKLGGNAYVLKVGPDVGPPRELWFLEPHNVEIEFSGEPVEPVLGYLYQTARGQRVKLPRPDVLHCKEWHPTEPAYSYGLPPLAAAGLSVDQNNSARRWNASLLENSARPSGILTVENKIAPNVRDVLAKDLEARFSGSKNAGRPPILEGGMKWQSMGFSPVEMDWLSGIKATTREICTVFGYPPELLGDPDLTTYSNRKDARKALYTETVLPELDYLRDELNAWLMPMFGAGRNGEGNARLYYDDDSVDALAEDRDAVWTRTNAAEMITVNEKRQALGYEDLGPEGEVVLIGGNKMTLEDVVAGPEPVVMPEPEPELPIEDDEDTDQ